MTSTVEHLEFVWYLDYKQLKVNRKEWLQSEIFYSSNNATSWCLQLDNSDSMKLGMYLTLIDGAPCTVRGYTLSMLTNSNPLLIYINQCKRHRSFPFNDFSWGFSKFCTRREFNAERRQFCDPKTEKIRVQCTMDIASSPSFTVEDDHLLATNIFATRSLGTWISLVRERYDLPELTNRINQEIEAQMS